jgi:hypothetical protein
MVMRQECKTCAYQDIYGRICNHPCFRIINILDYPFMGDDYIESHHTSGDGNAMSWT